MNLSVIIQHVNTTIGILFMMLYAYQFFYAIVPFFKKSKPLDTDIPAKRFAIITAARNEAAVIGQLMDSITAQDYPADRYTMFVIADNCTDNTAEVAQAHGAVVFERENKELVGKGYALHTILGKITALGGEPYDAFLVLDADNLLAPGYLKAMNASLETHNIVTGYRNSKNYGDNWISAGYALWFLRESQQLNRSRFLLGTSCMVSGTGFAFKRCILDKLGNGWPYHLLTEDIEFSVAQICEGESVGYCEQAQLYDEQPVKFGQSWHQRMRWAKGYYQVIGRYGGKMLRGMLGGSFACYDALSNLMPACILSIVTVVTNAITIAMMVLARTSLVPALISFGKMVLGSLGIFWLLGGLTLLTEWKHIRAPWYRKLWLWVLFPLYMITYLPIAIAAFFRRVEWKQIEHTRDITLEEMQNS